MKPTKPQNNILLMELWLNLSPLFGFEEAFGVNPTKLRWLRHTAKFILWTLYDWSQPEIAKAMNTARGKSISESVTRIIEAIDVKDKEYYPILLEVNKLYPILTLGYAKYRLKKEEEQQRRQKFGTSKRALKKKEDGRTTY